MKFNEIVQTVADGARFTINFQKRTCRVDGKLIEVDDAKDFVSGCNVIAEIELRYDDYKHSVPSERSESRRHYYFKALPEEKLSDSDMMYGKRREVARCILELFVLCALICEALKWQDEWGTWFWQSAKDKDLVILREWVEPQPTQE